MPDIYDDLSREFVSALGKLRDAFRKALYEAADISNRHLVHHLKVPLAAALLGEAARLISMKDAYAEPAYILLVSFVSFYAGKKGLRLAHQPGKRQWVWRVASLSLASIWIHQFFFAFPGTLGFHVLEVLPAVVFACLAFLWVMRKIIQQETQVELPTETLTENLKDVEAIFSTSTIPLAKWFEPISQIYFADLAKSGAVTQDRVLLFRPPRNLSVERLLNLTPHLDGYYATCLARIHRRHAINLLYLERADVLEIANSLPQEEREALGLIDNEGAIFDKFDFVLLTLRDGTERVILVNSGAVVVIDDESTFRAYRSAVNLIRGRSRDFCGLVESVQNGGRQVLVAGS